MCNDVFCGQLFPVTGHSRFSLFFCKDLFPQKNILPFHSIVQTSNFFFDLLMALTKKFEVREEILPQSHPSGEGDL